MSKTSELLKQDLAALGMTQKEFAERLSERIGSPISQQAISLWCQRDYVPPRRRDDVAAILGPDSVLIKYANDKTVELDTAVYKMHSRGAMIRSTSLDIDAAVLRLLPDASVNERHEVGPYTRRFSFWGKRSVVLIVGELSLQDRTRFSPFAISRALVNLAVAKRELNDGRDYILMLFGTGEKNQVEQIRWECRHLDVDFIMFADPDEAARYIADAEDYDPAIPVDLPDDTYQ